MRLIGMLLIGRGMALFLIGVMLVFPQFAQSSNAPNANAHLLTLDVLLVNDPSLPLVTAKDAQKIFSQARLTLEEKFGFSEIEFRIIGEKTSQDFISLHRSSDPKCLHIFEPFRVSVDPATAGQLPEAIPKDRVLSFLKRWELDALRNYFPPEITKDLKSFDSIYELLISEFRRKLELISKLKLADGEDLVGADSWRHRSYVNWLCAMRNQNEADFVLTNAFILFDLGSEPYPHTIFSTNKLGGASLFNWHREAIKNKAVLASTFSMVTDIPFFKEEGVETLSAEQRLSVIGTFLVAHELGHAVFRTPDFYDHPKECLMTTTYETGYVSGYHQINKTPGRCSKCRPYVDALRSVFLSRKAAAKENWAEAIALQKKAIKQTPKHIDGRYARYIVELSARLARLYWNQGDLKQCERWVKAILRVSPSNREALELKAKLEDSASRPAVQSDSGPRTGGR